MFPGGLADRCDSGQEGVSGAHDLGKDVRGGSRPDERFRGGIVRKKVRVNRLNQVGHTCEYATADRVLCDVAEEAPNHVQPGGASRSEVDRDSRILGKPSLDHFVLVSRVVVTDDVDRLFFGDLGLDATEKAKPLRMSVTSVATADDLAREDVERGEERRRSMSPVVMVSSCQRAPS